MALGKSFSVSTLAKIGGVAAAGLLLTSATSERAALATPSQKVSTPGPGGVNNEVFKNGEAGFVVTQIAYALGPDGKDGACPAGMSKGVRGLIEDYSKTSAGQRKEGEAKDAYDRRLSMAVQTGPTGKNICLNPEGAPPDPGFQMVSGKVKVDGMDLDGAGSGRPPAGSCSHEEFEGKNGERGVDNQWYRVVGCTTGFQADGAANSFQIEMYTGSWGILMTLKGVDDLRNDPDVQVGFYANADPIELSAARTALPYATYAASSDPRYRATTRGRIIDGVLQIDPVDVRFQTVVNGMTDDRELKAARVRLKFTTDGGLEGLLGGYAPVENMYDVQFGARHGRTTKGELAPVGLRVGTSVGRAAVLGHTCNGAYQALYRAADGNRDPATGKCTSISTQYRLRVAPAFVVDARTQSVNSPLTLR